MGIDAKKIVSAVPSFSKKWLYASAGMLLCLCLCNTFLFLGDFPIQRWDEARHGVSAYEMLSSGNYLINTFLFSPDYWNSKPPLSIWSVALGFQVFGFTPFGLRAISAVCSFLTVLLVVVFTAKHFSLAKGIFAGYILMTAHHFVLSHNARSGDPDALFILFASAAIFAVLYTTKNMYGLYLACFLLSLAFLTKSFHVVGAAVTVLIAAFGIHGRRVLRPACLVHCLFWGLWPVLLWAFLRYGYDGMQFFEKMFFYDVLQRVGTAIENHKESYIFYLKFTMIDFKYYTISLGILCVMSICARKYMYMFIHVMQLNNTYVLMILLAAAIPCIIFTISQTKLQWYTFPSYPFIAILFSVWIVTFLQNVHSIVQNKYIQALVFFILISACILQEARLLKSLYAQAQQQDAVQMQLWRAGQRYKNVDVYLEGAPWEQEYILAAQLYGGFTPQEGGKAAWEKNLSGTAILLKK